MFSNLKIGKIFFYPVMIFAFLSFSNCKKNNESYPIQQQISLNKTSTVVGDTITISGSGFDSDITKHTVKFGNITAKVISADVSKLKVIVPDGAVTGKVSVTTNGVTSLSLPSVIVYNVYVSGYEGNMAMYWRNGTTVYLTNGTNANSIALVKNGLYNDVYVAGTGLNNNGKYVAKYWKNGTSVNLSNGLLDANANSIFVVGSDVYVAGNEINTSGVLVAKYWKNGIATNLTSGVNNSYANSIVVVGSDVYVAGYESYSSGNTLAKYWKNGVAVNLSNGTNYADVKSMVVIGTDVYVVGSERNTTGISVAKYWKNGVSVNLTNGISDSFAYSMALIKNGLYYDVYVLGKEGNVNKYWVNGTAVNFVVDPYGTSTTSIAVAGSDVFVAGSVEYTNAKLIAKYWKNGIAVNLTNGADPAYTTSIALSPF